MSLQTLHKCGTEACTTLGAELHPFNERFWDKKFRPKLQSSVPTSWALVFTLTLFRELGLLGLRFQLLKTVRLEVLDGSRNEQAE